MDELVLASSSPRRTDLLRTAAIPFKTVEHSFDEESVSSRSSKRVAMNIAFGKAMSVAERDGYQDKWILGVDTVVSYRARVLGKPVDREEAEVFLRFLSNKKHDVISGMALINVDRGIVVRDYGLSTVYVDKLSDDFMRFYLDNEMWYDYAGGYAIQGLFSLVVKRIVGTYSNVVGLPVNKLYNMLKKAGFEHSAL